MTTKRTDRATVTVQAGYLYFVQDPRAVHPARHIHCVAPDVILWLLGPYHSGHYRSMVQP